MRLYQLTESVFKSAAGMQTEAALEPARADRRFNAHGMAGQLAP